MTLGSISHVFRRQINCAVFRLYKLHMIGSRISMDMWSMPCWLKASLSKKIFIYMNWRSLRVMYVWRFIFLCAFQRLNQIVNELEELKPEVLKKIEHLNFARQDAVLPSQNSTDNPSLARPTCLRNQSNLNANTQQVPQPSTAIFFFVSTCCFSQASPVQLATHFKASVCCCVILDDTPRSYLPSVSQ